MLAYETALTTLKDDGYWYDKGYGILITLDNVVAKYTYNSIGKMDDGLILIHGQNLHHYYYLLSLYILKDNCTSN